MSAALTLGLMQLVFLHGAPATGKLTVARALSALTGVPMVDNHAAIDMARMVFGFARPGFWDLVHDLRVTTLRGAARAGVPCLITTAAYSHPEDAALLRDYETAIGAEAGQLLPVYLHCRPETLMTRVGRPDRVQKGKLSTPEGLRPYLERNNFLAIDQEACLLLSTETTAPEETAEAIARHFDLPMVFYFGRLVGACRYFPWYRSIAGTGGFAMRLRLHANATTTPKTRAYIQTSSASVSELSRELGCQKRPCAGGAPGPTRRTAAMCGAILARAPLRRRKRASPHCAGTPG